MSLPSVFLLSVCLFLAACANQDGRYEPRCVAYEGDRVLLSERRFEWHKFTDQREISEQGEIIDPFPGYPKTGAFEIQAGRIQFLPDDGSSIADHFVVEHRNDWYLLPQAEHQEFRTANTVANCALQRQRDAN